MDVVTTMAERCGLPEYTAHPIDQATLNTVLESARLAPAATNRSSSSSSTPRFASAT